MLRLSFNDSTVLDHTIVRHTIDGMPLSKSVMNKFSDVHISLCSKFMPYIVFNSFWPSDVISCYGPWSTSVVACRLFDVKPSPEPTLLY